MTDQDFISLLETARKELVKRYGRKGCPDFSIGCGECKARILISLLDDEIDLLEWKPKTKDKTTEHRTDGKLCWCNPKVIKVKKK